jgi:hypothetical protein
MYLCCGLCPSNVQGLPKEWETMLRSAGIDPEEFNKHKGAAVKAVEFYQNMINVQPSTSHLPPRCISICRD